MLEVAAMAGQTPMSNKLGNKLINELIIDALGRLSRPSEPTRSSFRGPPECLEHVGHHRGRQSDYWQPPNLPRVVLESQIPSGIRTETI